jgi:hypothetical protein
MPDLTTTQYEKTQYVRCNTIGHAWDDVDSNHWTASYGTPFTVRCERCGTERRDRINPSTGQIVANGRRYLYPTGYKYSAGTRPNRAEFRLMLLQQRIKETRAARKAAMSAS